MNAVIYSKPGCPHCVEAKRVLTERGITYKEIIVDGVSKTKQQMIQEIGVGELNTVPQILLDGKFIPGGCSGLKAHFGI